MKMILITIAQWMCFGLGGLLALVIVMATGVAAILSELVSLFNFKK